LVASVDFMSRSLGEAIQIETAGAAGLWTVEVDANQLEVALLNLAINARDVMPVGSHFCVRIQIEWNQRLIFVTLIENIHLI
jgi:signal transduction histidine kinase